ncbi:MAG: hypothetical protein LUI07_07905, partial [Lachnospiraceae bacterium]|nr:hypothetical protein [Lachnospiraceae bacterium]
MSELMSAISDSTGENSEVGTAIETAVSDGQKAIEGAADSYSQGGASLGEAVAEGIAESAEEIGTAVGEAVKSSAESVNSSENVSAYKEAGKELGEAITEGVTEGITENAESGEMSSAAEKLADAAVSGFAGDSSSLSHFTDAGNNAANAYIESIGAWEESARTEAQKLADAAVEALKETSGFDSAGNGAAFAYNTPFSSDIMTSDAETQAGKLADAAKDALNGKILTFEALGNESAGAYAQAFKDYTDTAESNAKELASQALAAINAYKSSFGTAGYNMSAGVASGISLGQSQAVTAAINMAKAALKAAKDELGIKSPSKKFKEDVGEMIGKGMASGISSSSSAAAGEAEAMSGKVYTKAVSWLSKYKKSQDVSLADEEYYWKQIAKQCEEGTTAYNKAVAKMIKASVSTTTTTGSGSNKKTTKKDTETYYSDIYDAAADYMDKLQTLNDVSLEEQLSYWQAIQKQLKKGTDAWYDAQKEINSILEDYESSIVSAAETTMDHMQILNDVSISDQIAYWKEVRSELTKYSDEWYEVTEKIKNLREQRKKEAEEANAENLSDVEKTMEHMQILNDVSLEDQISYWTKELKEYKKYSDEWYEIKEKLKDLNEELAEEKAEAAEKAAEEAAEAISAILSDAETALSHTESLYGGLSLDAEIAYWKEIKEQLEKEGGEYSDEWYEVLDKINDLSESYYDEIYSYAENYASNMETLDSWSINEQLAYWQSVQKQLKKGTDAWYSAQQKINSIKSGIGTVSNMSSLLNAYQTYYEMSEKAEMQYWDTVRQQYEEGTDERLEADQNYLDAKESYYDRLEDLEEDYADAVADIEEKLADEIESLTDSYNNSLQDRINTIKDAYGLFDEFTSESADGQTLLFNLQSQAAGYEAWSDALDGLAERGVLSEDLLEELTEMGPDQIAAIYALSDLTDEELTAYQEAYDRKMDAATKQAEEDTADLKAELETQTAELNAQAEADKEELKKTYEESVASVNENISTELLTLAENARTIAEDQTTALVSAISGGVSAIEAAIKASNDTADTAAETGQAVAEEAVSSGTSGVSSSSGTSSSSSTSSGSKSSTSTVNVDSLLDSAVSRIIASGGDTGTVSSIADIIRSGTIKTSYSGTGHTELYKYIADKYKRSLSGTQLKTLAKALGVNTSKSGYQTEALAKLKEKGFRSGGKNIEDELIWMDEELDTKGPEMIVRKSDNAILTRVHPGDDVIDADTTDNLLQLGKISPDDLMSVLAKQQEAAVSYLDTLNAAGSAQMNQIAEAGGIMGNNMDLSRLEGQMESIGELVSEFLPYLPYLAEKQQIVLDPDKLVGGIESKMSSALAMSSRRRRS